MPGHTSREILIVLSSLTTCDPGNIYELIKVENPPSLCFPVERKPAVDAASPRLEPEVSEGPGVSHRPVGRGAGVYGVNQGDGRLVPRHPGRESLQGAADAARQTSACQLLVRVLFDPNG